MIGSSGRPLGQGQGWHGRPQDVCPFNQQSWYEKKKEKRKRATLFFLRMVWMVWHGCFVLQLTDTLSP